jgi:hypothetical protein
LAFASSCGGNGRCHTSLDSILSYLADDFKQNVSIVVEVKHLNCSLLCMSSADKSSQRVYVHNGEVRVFDCNLRRNVTEKEFHLSRAEKRRYQRLISGLNVGAGQNERQRFMTLTTARGVKRGINKSFDALKKRINRATPKKDGFHGFKFNRYFKLKTAEGNDVLHIVYRGRYIPQKWLSKVWAEIHQGSFIVDIRELHWKRGTKN